MTEAEAIEECKLFIKSYTNNYDIIFEGGAKLALDIMVHNVLDEENGSNIQKKTHREISITYFQNKISNKVKDLLRPYRKMRW